MAARSRGAPVGLKIVRVVGGVAGGRRLRAPVGRSIRPTSDRVREAVFDALSSLGAVEDATVVDLFAGTGALGIEALSRGASDVTFVDRDRAAASAIRSNLDAVGLASDNTHVVRSDVLRWLEAESRTFDLALCDPPYDFTAWDRLFGLLSAGLAVLESASPVEPAPGWVVRKTKRYGGTVVTLVQPLPHPVARKGGS